ncbi:MAG: hypothetical protein Q8R54_03045 [Methylobacter sp.]|nr:hypothetical protein [Methylobacter sp.]
MPTSYAVIPLINQLNHSDKLRLAQWLIKVIAQEEGINDVIVLEEDKLSNDEQHIQHCLTQIQQGDYSEFDGWESVKNQL